MWFLRRTHTTWRSLLTSQMYRQQLINTGVFGIFTYWAIIYLWHDKYEKLEALRREQMTEEEFSEYNGYNKIMFHSIRFIFPKVEIPDQEEVTKTFSFSKNETEVDEEEL